jgi:glycerophosphoryl diester phosphodiesterase
MSHARPISIRLTVACALPAIVVCLGAAALSQPSSSAAPPAGAQPLEGNAMPLIVAHRGASGEAPENTLASFKLAWLKQADAIEGDFHLTRDRKIVCIHDATTGRVAGRNLVVAQSTLADLRALDVGAWKGAPWQGQQIPTLEEVLALVPPGKKLYLEIKSGPEILPPLKEALAAAKLKSDQVILLCFDKTVLEQCRTVLPDLKTFWLVAFKNNPVTARPVIDLDKVMETLRTLGAAGLSVSAATAELAQAVRAAGKELHVWTIDDPKAVGPLVWLGCASITTNYPDRIRQAAMQAK